MMWVSVISIEADEDPGFELVTVLKARFGESVRTNTQAQWLYDEARKPPAPVGKPPSQTVTLPRARGVR